MKFFIDEKISSVEVTNQVMKAMIEDTKEKIQNCEDSEVKDAAILACVQTINHFKISFYGTATAFANALNVKKHAGLFHESEVNEKEIDERLTQLAEHDINIIAKAPILIPS